MDLTGETPRAAPKSFRLMAGLFDFSWGLALLAVAISLLDLPPLLDLATGIPLTAAYCLVWLIQEKFWSGTLGKHLWGLRSQGVFWHPVLARGNTEPPFLHQIGRSLLTFSCLAGALAGFAFATLGHPIQKRAEIWQLPLYVPSSSELDSQDWIILPYYYALGAWPMKFMGRPVLQSIPYEKGPPDRFPGRMVARLHSDISLTIEGPKTPSAHTDPDTLRDCIAGSGFSFSCLRIRQGNLLRHFREMKARGADHWELRWFQVLNPSISDQEAAHGLYLSATSKDQIEERYVLITPHGAHQAIILRRLKNQEGEFASQYIRKAVGSLRVWESLDPGKAWIARELSETQLTASPATNLSDPTEFVRRMGRIQMLLMSKISVDPKDFNAYYHLGGTAMMLLRHTVELRTQRNHVIDRNFLLMLDDWNAVQKPLVKAMWNFAEDIDPNSPNTTRLYQLVIESKDF